MGADEFEREGMIGKVAQEGIEFFARESIIAERISVAFQDAVQQPQAVGAGQAVQFELASSGQPGVAGPAGDEHTTLAFACGEVAEQIGKEAAFFVGVGRVLMEGREHAFIIVPDHEDGTLVEKFDCSPSLLGGRALVELRAFAVFSEHRDHAIGIAELLEADEACAVAEQAAAGPPVGGLGG